MKKTIPAAAFFVAAVILVVYTALLPSYGEKMRASVLRAPQVEQYAITATPKPASDYGYVLVSNNGFEIRVSPADTSDMYIYD